MMLNCNLSRSGDAAITFTTSPPLLLLYSTTPPRIDTVKLNLFLTTPCAVIVPCGSENENTHHSAPLPRTPPRPINRQTSTWLPIAPGPYLLLKSKYVRVTCPRI